MSDPVSHVTNLLATYGDPRACVAELLCDRHESDALAYRIIDAELNSHDLAYGELREESERFAAALSKLGIGPGDRVATLMGKSRSYLVVLMGIWRAGAVHVPLFTAFAPAAIALRLDGSGARMVVCDADQQHKLAPGDHIPASPPWHIVTRGQADGRSLCLEQLLAKAGPALPAACVGGNAPLIHIYTSGTTGNPKGVVVPVRALAAFRAYAEFGLDLRDGDTFWCAADPGWAYGLYYGVLTTFLTGVRSILLEGGFSPDATMTILEGEQVTNFAAAPTVYRALRASEIAPGPLRLRCASSAGEPLTAEVNDWARKTLGVEVRDHYGQTEAGMVINNHHHPAIARPIRANSMGQVMPGWSAAVLCDDRDGEIAAGETGRVAFDLHNSPLAWFSGYAGDAEKTAGKFSADGRWYLTGDVARRDDDGFFYFSSRDDDVIIMAGYRIGPFEVETVMGAHPAVAECAVIAVPDEVRGEVMEAFVVLREGQTPSDELENDIKQWVKRNYAAHAFPRRIHFTTAMPKTPSGKIQRFVLKAQREKELD
ncbi:MAG: AMP-binding protein [Novosphingobium sp.]|nr:AMP-binding protein [Novosphingobium sp.]